VEAAVVEAAVVEAAVVEAARAAGRTLKSLKSRLLSSPHFLELRDDVDRCRIAGFQVVRADG